MATDLVVIGQGRLLEQCTVGEFVARWGDHWVRVRSSRAADLARSLATGGAHVALTGDGVLDVRGTPIEAVGELAARDGIVLHELSPADRIAGGRVPQGDRPRPGVPQHDPGGADVIDALRSEWIKLRTILMNWILIAIAVAFPPIVCILTTALQKEDDITSENVVGLVSGTSVVTALLLGVIGATAITGEFGFGTIRPTFAACPRRHTVVIAKAIVTAVVAVLAETVVVVVDLHRLLAHRLGTRRADLDLRRAGGQRAAARRDRVRRARRPARLRPRPDHPQHPGRRRRAAGVAAGDRGAGRHACSAPSAWTTRSSSCRTTRASSLGNPDAGSIPSCCRRCRAGLYFGSVTAVVLMIGARARRRAATPERSRA